MLATHANHRLQLGFFLIPSYFLIFIYFTILFYKFVMFASYCAQSSTKELFMPTENTSLKNIPPTGDYNTINEMVIRKINTYQRSFLIVAGSLLALLVLISFLAQVVVSIYNHLHMRLPKVQWHLQII